MFHCNRVITKIIKEITEDAISEPPKEVKRKVRTTRFKEGAVEIREIPFEPKIYDKTSNA